jgi:hypothetical protein
MVSNSVYVFMASCRPQKKSLMVSTSFSFMRKNKSIKSDDHVTSLARATSRSKDFKRNHTISAAIEIDVNRNDTQSITWKIAQLRIFITPERGQSVLNSSKEVHVDVS